MMKSKKLLTAGIAAGILVVGYSAHVIATTVTAQNASATLVAPITVTPGTALNFGQVSYDTAGATTVVLDPTLAANPASSADGAGVFAGTANRADFALSAGLANATYTVNFTAVPGDITASGCGACPANSVEINTLTWASASLGASAGQLDGTGADTMYVGGTLSMATTAAGGSYSGTYDMEVVYN